MNNEQEKLETQLERSEFFTHTLLSQYSTRINEIESFLYAVIDILIQKGIVSADDFAKAVAQVRQEIVEKGESCNPNLALRMDREQDDEFIPVNCQERLPICQAVCCKLDFALSPQEVESGQIKWDLGRPYFIRQEKEGYCTHNDPETKGCKIYENRPSVCKKYSCAKDERIWKDFEKMELNQEWINHYTQQKRPKLIG
ncbi:protein of unknown function UPF0153 [Gloeothece citriformis PCC 7424]|uniref:YkgJ family cysteine cluster protein n=1 Tax=Gloeothece citriformis (strain PCC 7424) TaxID=65393 RepID=B7KG31_GLOC7|nr:YkgJ family cysteine cluster protein [Gloeothece citriformis]ACK69224.1 protein of unknown function UPF0153 [Gloeothece citriformis PCC 7424]